MEDTPPLNGVTSISEAGYGACCHFLTRKLRPRKVKDPAQSHTASGWQSWAKAGSLPPPPDSCPLAALVAWEGARGRGTHRLAQRISLQSQHALHLPSSLTSTSPLLSPGSYIPHLGVSLSNKFYHKPTMCGLSPSKCKFFHILIKIWWNMVNVSSPLLCLRIVLMLPCGWT